MSLWALGAEVSVTVINIYLAFIHLSKTHGHMDNSATKVLLFNCLAINLGFSLLWLVFESLSATLAPKTYEERAQFQLFTIFAILLNGDIYWMFEI